MQIRISKSGKRVELLRSRYIPEKKRTTQDLVVSFDYSSEQVSEKVLDRLTANEKIEVEEWFEKHTFDRREKQIKQKVESFVNDIEVVIEGIGKYGITHDQAQGMYAGVDRLVKVIRQAGFTRLKNKEKPAGQKKSKK